MELVLKKSHRRYEAYRKSKIEWMGEIPIGWSEKPNKRIFKLKKNLVGASHSKYDLLSLTLKGVIKRDLDEGGKFPADFDSYQIVEKGDFVFCLFDVEETPRTVGLSELGGMITGAYTVFEVSRGFDPRFLMYFYLNLDSDKRLKPLYTGLRNTISKDAFLSFKTFLPSENEQTAIAAYLDEKTSKIDKVIAQKKKLIELLKERQQILVQELVTGKKVWNEEKQAWTKPDKVKDSGVEWIGEIPAFWKVKKLKYVLTERNERSKDGTEPLLMVSQMHGLVVRSEYHDKAEVAASAVDNKIVHPGDLVFNKLKAHLGVFFKNALGFKGLVSPDYAVYSVKNEIEDLKILESLFRNPSYITQFVIRATGIVEGLIRLYTPNLFAIPIPIAPPIEQGQILNGIEELTNDHQNLIQMQVRMINHLHQYKESLIDSAVTGKIRVS